MTKGKPRSLKTHIEVPVELPISVLVASDFPKIRNSMRQLLNDIPDVCVIACTGVKSEVLPLADAHRPQTTILDLEVEWTGLFWSTS